MAAPHRGYDKGHSSGHLNVKWFQHKGVTYTIVNLTHAVDGPLSLVADVTGTNALGNNNAGLVLDIRNTGFFLEKHQFGHGTIHLWNDPGLTWNVGDVILVRLRVAGEPAALEWPELTATVREPDVFGTRSSVGSFSVDFTWQPGQRAQVHYQMLTP